MTNSEIRRRLETDRNFIACKRFDYRLDRLMERYNLEKYPDCVPSKVIAQALMMSEDELQAFEQQLIKKLQGLLRVDLS